MILSPVGTPDGRKNLSSQDGPAPTTARESSPADGSKDDDICQLLSGGFLTAAFELVMKRYQIKVVRLAYVLLGNASHAEEVTQDIFLKLWQVLKCYNGQASLSTWIYTIARNTCLSHRRSEAYRRVSPLNAAPEPTTTTASAGLQLEVRQLVARLPEEQRRIVELFYLQERSIKDVAVMLALPEGTVKSHLHQARKNMGKILEGK